MTWWLVPLILGVIVAGILTGLKVSNILLGRQEKGPLFSFKRGLQVGRRKQSTSADIAKDSQKTSVNEQRLYDVKAYKNDVLSELEYNLAIADKPLNGKLNVFQTTVWDNRHGEFDVLDPDIKWQVTQAYTDMFLANSLVRMSNEIGEDNKALSSSYLNLKSKIAERLQQILSTVKTALNE